MDIDRFLDEIPGRAGAGGDDGPLFSQKVVEKARFTHIGSAGDDQTDPMAVDLAFPVCGDEGVDFVTYFLKLVGDRHVVGDIGVVSGEFNGGLKTGDSVDDSLAQGRYLCRELALVLRSGKLQPPFCPGVDHVRHRFRL